MEVRGDEKDEDDEPKDEDDENERKSVLLKSG